MRLVFAGKDNDKLTDMESRFEGAGGSFRVAWCLLPGTA
jgi:hypothetical protein